MENLGTRAANNLQGQAQQAREAKAGAPVTANGSEAAPLNIGGTPASSASAQYRSPRPTPTATGSTDYGGPEFRQPDASNPNWGSLIAPPQLPPDAPPASAVSIRLDTDD